MDFFGAGARWLKRVCCIEEKSKKKQRKDNEIFAQTKHTKNKN